MTGLWQDFRHAARMFMKSPVFTITALAALAIGIGAPSAIFTVVNAVLLRPLPVPDPDRFLMLMTESSDGPQEIASPAEFEHWRKQKDVLQDVAAFQDPGVMNWTGRGLPEQLNSMTVSGDFFRCWGVPLVRGRGFSAAEDAPRGPLAAVITEDIWQQKFAHDPQILNRTISLNGQSYSVAGVAGMDVMRRMGLAVDVYVPFRIDPNTTDRGHFFQVSARLRPGVTLAHAQARLRVSSQEYEARFPHALGKGAFTVKRFHDAAVGDVRRLLLILQAAVVLVLLIACANVANLLLARDARRRREMGIRAAMGASRGRILRQMLTESLMLSLMGGMLGLALGYAGIRGLLAMNTVPMTSLAGDSGSLVTLDWRVAFFALAVSIASGILFGVVPALRGSRRDLSSVLKENSGRTGTGLRQSKVRAALLVSEMTLAVVLLVGAALCIRTILALYAVQPGFETKNVFTMGTLLAGPRYTKTADAAEAIRRAADELRAVPGVEAVATTCCVPMRGGFGLGFDVVGRPAVAESDDTEGAGWAAVGPGFFDVFRIPLRRGRVFTYRDNGAAEPVMLINEKLAAQIFKGRNPVGERILIGKHLMKEFDGEPVRRIVGVVGNVLDRGLDREQHPIMYVPQAQLPDALTAFLAQGPMNWVVRARPGSERAAAERLRAVTGVPIPEILPMERVIANSTGQQKFNMLLMTVFGCAALLLAAVGVYGLMAYTVEERRREIGIRLALGSRTDVVRNRVVAQGMSIAGLGIAIGLCGAWGLARLMQSLLFGVQPHDAAVFIGVPAVLCATALVAVWIPALRASRVNAMEALRCD